jgi:hypothetical protein
MNYQPINLQPYCCIFRNVKVQLLKFEVIINFNYR